jgi:dTDP-4-dehydrorhamnose 3,5-epimerase
MLNTIEGVSVIKLITHADKRGFFREILRETDDSFSVGFGQLSHSLVYSGVVKAWHAHKVQSQWTYAVTGTLKVALHDLREDSVTYHNTMEFEVGENTESMVYMFPQGVAHGYKCINGPANVIYVTSGQYDMEDEVRIPYDDPDIGFDWLAGIAIK